MENLRFLEKGDPQGPSGKPAAHFLTDETSELVFGESGLKFLCNPIKFGPILASLSSSSSPLFSGFFPSSEPLVLSLRPCPLPLSVARS